MFSPRGLTPTSPPGGTASLPAQHAQGRKTGGLFSPDPNVHLFDRLAIIVKHWKVALGVAMLVIAGMMYQTYTTVPLYRAQARIQIDEEHTAAQTDFKEPSLVYTDPEPYYQTQYKILQGRDLALRAVKRLQLQTVPEFNGRGAKPPALAQAIADIKAKVVALVRRVIAALVRRPLCPSHGSEKIDAVKVAARQRIGRLQRGA